MRTLLCRKNKTFKHLSGYFTDGRIHPFNLDSALRGLVKSNIKDGEIADIMHYSTEHTESQIFLTVQIAITNSIDE